MDIQVFLCLVFISQVQKIEYGTRGLDIMGRFFKEYVFLKLQGEF